MVAYVYVNIEITDPEGFKAYGGQVPETIAKFGGRYLARGGPGERLEGDMPARRQVLLEFPDMAALKAWYGSEEYRPLLELRQRTSTGDVMVFEGVAPPA